MTKENTSKNVSGSPRKSKTYYVKGMHCASCEILIEKELSKLTGVDQAHVSLKKGSVEILSTTQEFPDPSVLNTTLGSLGYSFSLDKPSQSKLTGEDSLKVLGVFLLFVFIFLMFEKSGLLMNFTVSGESSVTAYFVFGLLAGLSSCAALVGGLLLSLSGQWNALYNGNTKKSYLPFLYFNGARVFAFGVLGGLLGLIGSYVSISIAFSTVVSFLIALLMLVIGLQMLGVGPFKKLKLSAPKTFTSYISDESNFKGKYMPLFIGALTFFVPCGFTLIAQTNAITSGSFWQGALMLTAFALGTLPVLAFISFSSVKFYTNPSFSKKFNLFSGLLITFFSLYTLNSQLNVLGLPSLSDLPAVFARQENAVEAQLADGMQVLQMEAAGFQYYPPVTNIKAGVPTRWEIYNSGASGCAQAVFARGLFPNVIYLQPGLNVVEFTPMVPGTYKVSCSMGMVPPITVNVY